MSSKKQRMLFFSNLYPSPARPNHSTFNFQQVHALAEWFEISVISPISWRELKVRRAARKPFLDGPPVVYPTYWNSPGIFRSLYGPMMLASATGSAKKMYGVKPFDLVFGSWLYPDGWVASRLAHAWQVPCYLKVHGTDVNRLSSKGRLTAASLQAVQNSKGVICVSHALKDRLVELGIPENKCHVVYNGINSELFQPRSKTFVRKQLNLPKHDIIVLFVGNLLETKGLGELVKAFGNIARKRPNVRLIVAGTGSWGGNFRDRVRMEGLETRVDILGSIDHKKIGLYMNAANVLCLPSYMEGVPNVVLEALASDTTVVSTSVGGIPELAYNDSRIILALPRDVASLQDALERGIDGGFSGVQRITIQSWYENAATIASLFLGSEVQT